MQLHRIAARLSGVRVEIVLCAF